MPDHSTSHITAFLITIFSYLLVIFSALHSADKPIPGGDTWMAMACGRYTLGPWAMHDEDRSLQMKLLDMFGIHTTWHDPFSAYSRPYYKDIKGCEGWINQNWLSHVIFYKLNMAFGEFSLVVYKFIQAILTALFVFWAARILKVNCFIAALCTSFGILMARSFVDMRPNISTMMMAAIMICILFRWKAGHPKSVLWMIPLMLIWSNIHGGFIYAIVVFAIACGGYGVSNLISSAKPRLFRKYRWKGQYIWLPIGLGISVLVPVIFSPFGVENLFHPMKVMFGSEGKLWRNVSEWHPLFSEGFGNVEPFKVFGLFFVIAYLAWLILRTKEKHVRVKAGNNSTANSNIIDLDLAWLGIIVLTIYMAIRSRRFVFLAGVVLAPFLAVLTQQIIIMTEGFWTKKLTPALTRRITAALAVLSVISMALIFWATLKDTYMDPPADGIDIPVFRKMVVIQAQPVQAMKFFNANKVRGIVLNEWSDGGYVLWGQVPDEKTGGPPCQVYIDGRAQAAYSIEHFLKYKKIRINIQGSEQRLKKDLEKRRDYLNKLITIARLKKSARIYDKLIDFCAGKAKLYYALLYAMGADAELYSKVLEHEKITVVLATTRRAKRTIDYLSKVKNWDMLYMDATYTMFFRKNAIENKHLFEIPINKLIYPDNFSRQMSLAQYYIDHRPSDTKVYYNNLLKADKLLAKIDKKRLNSALKIIWRVKHRLKKRDELKRYLKGEYDRIKKLVDNNTEFGRISNLITLRSICRYMARLSAGDKDYKNETFYKDQGRICEEKLKQYKAEQKRRWFW